MTPVLRRFAPLPWRTAAGFGRPPVSSLPPCALAIGAGASLGGTIDERMRPTR